jgi:lipopolysaccharide exporter
LLSPEDFGLLGIALLTLSMLEIFSETGFRAALIQKKENIESYLDTAWTVAAIRGVILFLILYLSSPIISKLFNSSQAMLVIKVISISILLSGFRNIKILIFQKELEFKKQFIYEFSATISDLIVAISLAFILRNVWALVWGVLAANLVRFVMSYVLLPYCPKFRIQKKKFIDLFGFGKWVLGSGILVFLTTQGDDIFVGKILGVATLGFYQVAYMLSNLPATEVTHVISRVTFPAYSKLQGNLSKIKEGYLNVLQIIAFFSFPLAGGIFILVPDFTKVFLGEKWMPIIPVVQVLVLAGLIRSIAATTGPVFHGVGKPKINTFWQTIRLIVLIALIYPLSIRWSIVGTSLAVLVSILIATVGFSFEVIKITKCGVGNFVKMIILPLVNAGFMVLIIFVLKSFIQLNSYFEFFFLVGVGCLSYIIITYLLDELLNYEIQKLIKNKIVLR